MTFVINDIILYKSGVGFFNGICKETEFNLPVNDEDIDDVLKSLAIDGLKSVTFSTAEEKEDIQKKIGINIDSEQAFASFGKHLIGLEVEIEADNSYQGKVLGIDFILLDDFEDDESGIDVLVIQEKGVIKQIPLSKIRKLKLLDEIIKKDLDVYLNLESITRKAGVTNLKILTEMKDASIQWVSPISAWRLSYRIQFDQENNKANFIGIAIIDNSTSIDWEKIRLKLVTGRPVSFRYDLHTPFYVDRPWVSRDERGTSPLLAQEAISADKPRMASGYGSDSGYDETGRLSKESTIKLKDEADWGISRQALAADIQGTTEELGATVIYTVKKPVTINRSESSLIPLFSNSMKGETCVVVREDRIQDAMDAILFKKAIELEKGVATIYLDDIFAGDAMVVRGTDYLTYRLNQDIKVLTEIESDNVITGVSISNKIMIQKYSQNKKHKFRILNVSDKDITLILEIRKTAGFESNKKPDKESVNYYRYRFVIKPGTTEKSFIFTRKYTESIYIRNLSESLIQELIKDGILDDKNERKVLKILANVRKIADLDKELEDLNSDIDWVYKNQERIRNNILTLQKILENEERNSYIEKLKISEKQLEVLESEKRQLAKEIERLRTKI